MHTYILSAKRTPIGAFMGALSSVPAPRLGAVAIKAVLKEANLPVEDVQECIMGQVITAGTGQGPCRQAALSADLQSAVPCTTVNKVCGSGLKSVIMAQDLITLQKNEVIVAGGQESMSLSPHLVSGSRAGFKWGHKEMEDSLLKDGLTDPFHKLHMGELAEQTAKHHHITRAEQDDFAIKSYKKAQAACLAGAFDSELVSVLLSEGKKSVSLKKDEEPFKAVFEKIPKLKPAFQKEGGTITAANASKINDGASVCLLAAESYVQKKQLKPLARLISSAGFADRPEHFTTAPVKAIQKNLKQAGMKIQDIDLFEINEAFSLVVLAALKELSISEDKVNPHGGAVALGHPIGASGTRILTTLLHSLIRHKKKYGCAAICMGGGEALSVLIENLIT